MKYIIKQVEPDSFSAWKALENEDWQPNFDNLQSPEKGNLKNSLLSEQGYLCCYCNAQVSAINSHIEHFKPQCDYPDLDLNYQNLLVSCSVKKQCGDAKGNWFDSQQTMSPLSADCEQKLRYTDDGHIFPFIDQGSDVYAFINKLNLDDAILVKKRREAIKGWLSDDFIVDATIEDLLKIKNSLNDLKSGEYEPFGFAVQQQIASLLSEPT